MAPPDRVYRSFLQMPYGQPTSASEPYGILTTLGHLGSASRPERPHRGILGFMLPDGTDDDGGDRRVSPGSRASAPARMPASMAEVSRAEIMNLPPYERWLVTLPDDSPELTSFSDPRVGPAPSNPPRQLINKSTIDPGTVVVTSSDDLSEQGQTIGQVVERGPGLQPNIAELMANGGPWPGSKSWGVKRAEPAYPGHDPAWFATSNLVLPPHRRARHDMHTNKEADRKHGGPWGGRPLPIELRQKFVEMAHDRASGRHPVEDLEQRRQEVRDRALALSKKPHWRDEFSDGCSSPVPTPAEFAEACRLHDRDYYEAAKSREQADRDFLDNMLVVADKAGDTLSRDLLRRSAEAMYWGVRIFGDSYYNKP